MTDTETTRTTARRVWTSILVAVAILFALLLLAALGLGVYVSHRYTATTFMPAPEARFAFDEALAIVTAREPLVEVDDADIVVHRLTGRPRRDINAMHVLAYDPGARKLLNVSVPGWLLRMASRGHARLKISETEILQRLDGQIGLDDLERHGPGLVLDTTDLNGRRLLIWTE
ncbi:MAG TPA: hypothetical protein VH417_05225 [Vicinamibacterales bacterium]|jgi:hypothetical protein